MSIISSFRECVSLQISLVITIRYIKRCVQATMHAYPTSNNSSTNQITVFPNDLDHLQMP